MELLAEIGETLGRYRLRLACGCVLHATLATSVRIRMRSKSLATSHNRLGRKLPIPVCILKPKLSFVSPCPICKARSSLWHALVKSRPHLHRPSNRCTRRHHLIGLINQTRAPIFLCYSRREYRGRASRSSNRSSYLSPAMLTPHPPSSDAFIMIYDITNVPLQ